MRLAASPACALTHLVATHCPVAQIRTTSASTVASVSSRLRQRQRFSGCASCPRCRPCCRPCCSCAAAAALAPLLAACGAASPCLPRLPPSCLSCGVLPLTLLCGATSLPLSLRVCAGGGPRSPPHQRLHRRHRRCGATPGAFFVLMRVADHQIFVEIVCCIGYRVLSRSSVGFG